MKRLYKLAGLQLLLLLSSNLFAQQITVLPGNNNYSPQSGPQGALRSQRQFYLIRPQEARASGLAGGTAINQIGFTIGIAQDSITRGAFKVWLLNTADQISRIDSSWKEVTINTNTHSSRFFPGEYEVQVIPVATCPIVADTLRFSFSNRNLEACQPPTGLKTTSITATSATLNWVAPANAPTQYKVSYKATDAAVWTTANTASTSLNISGLTQNKLYQWRIVSDCSGDSSEIAGDNFTTAIASVCNPPTGLTVLRLETSATDTLAVLKWTAASGAQFYSVNYRRTGTINWSNLLSFTDSLVVRHLQPGTTYEWQVKTNCASGSGDYQNGPGFTTNGTVRCYAPYNLAVNTLTDSTAVLAWDAYPGVTSHKIRYRLKGTIPWTDAINGMTQVFNDSIDIPNQTGLVSVNLPGTYTYTADSGLYVAFEYSRVTGDLSSENITVSTTVDSMLNISGQNPIRFPLSFSSRPDSGLVAQDSILTNSDYRPETIFGSASLVDSVAVLAVWTLGKTAPRFQDTTIVSAQISNRSLTVDRRFGVRLTIKNKQTGALRYSKIDSITVRAAIDTIITFKEWVPVKYENDSVIISIDPRPTENVTNNNSKGFIQSVNPNLLAYADETSPITQVGFDTSPGLLLTKHKMKGCGKVIAAQVFLTTSSKGHSVYAVLRNSAGTITQSLPFTPDSTQTNSYHSFYFSTPVAFQNEDFYIGLAQPASATPYRPVGAQWENSVSRAGAFYKANLDGTGLVDSSGFGRLMIRAEIIPSSPQPFIDSAIDGKIYLCSSGTRILSAGNIEERFADSVISYSSQDPNIGYRAIQALGTPDVYPAYGTVYGAWLSEQPDSTRPNKHEYIELRFPNPDQVNFIDIYETANPGAVDTVWVKNSVTLNYDTVFTRIPDTTLTPVARKYRVTFPLTPNPVSQIKISLNSGKIPGYNAIDAVAIGKMTVPATYSNYAWTGPGIVGATNTQSITVNAPGNYKVTVTTAAGCTPSSDSVTVISTPASVAISPAGTINICAGDSIWLKSSIVGGNTWSNGLTADSIKVKTTGTYSLINNVGCGTLTSNSVTVNVNQKPTARITGNLFVCPSLTTTLNGGPGYNTYQWKNAAGTILGTSQTYAVSVSGLIKLVVDSLGCKDSTTVFVNNAPAPAPVITGVLQFCAGNSTTLDAGAFSLYDWRNSAGTTVSTARTLVVTTADNFYVTVTNGFGCSATSATVTTSQFPFTTPTITGNSSFCPGGSLTLTASAGYVAYRWSPGNQTTQSITVSAAGTYTVTATAANGCEGSASRVITLDPIPTPVITGSLIFCPGGDSTTLDAGPGYASYQWRNGIGTIIGTNRTVNVYSADNFYVIVTNSSGCAGTSPFVTTSLLPFTPPTITGNSSFCPGTSITLTASTGYTSYVWKNSAGTTVGTSAALVVTTADTYTVTVTAANGCKGSLSRTITQTVPPHPVISGSLQFCVGSSTTLNAGPGYTSYIWKNGAGVVVGTNQTYVMTVPGFIRLIVDSTGGCSDSTSVITTTIPGPTPAITGSVQFCAGSSTILNAGAGFASYTWLLNGSGIVGTNQTLTVLAAGSYSVIVTNGFGCSGTSPAVNVTVFPLPTPGITGNSTFCPGGSVTLTANAGYTSYLWAPGGATTPSISVSTAGTYTVTVTDGNGCIGSINKIITQAVAPAPTITGLTNICTGSTTTLNAGVGYTSYSWSPGGATSQTITVGTAATYTVTVTNASGCSGTANATVTVTNSVPPKPGPITGPVNNLCNTTGNLYSITPVPGATSYVWTVPSGATIIGPNNGVSITVNYSTSFTTGNITVAAFNVCGQNPTNDPRELAVTSLPAVPGAISGPTTGLCQRTGVVYSIAPVLAATTYTWTVPAGVTITAGQGTNSITVSFSGTFIDGPVSVLVSNACGANSTASTLALQGPTLAPGPITGAAIGDCRLESQTYSIAAVNFALSYTWVAPPRVTILEGQGTTSVKVKFDDDFVTGDLCVYTNTACGRSAYRCMTVFESPCPNFIVYPNPTSGIVKALVKFGPYGKYTLRIANFLTQVVYEKEFTWSGIDWTIDLSRIPSGVYDVTIYNDSYKRTTKLVKIN
ncbi:MAG: T9SS type A sorting domain-containing protein [Chitinophagaceae bacterium]|nr:T9SS type A sorting domain-containing protein [Chitinophagaceae bacterium]